MINRATLSLVKLKIRGFFPCPFESIIAGVCGTVNREHCRSQLVDISLFYSELAGLMILC